MGGIHLAKWYLMEIPKELGSWGLENIYIFVQYLVGRIL
jgi:hypothetical protein